ncbi:hypothetical protein T4B_7691 [Trichinella pseudospiralis]|uniref:Uncharacterized protein n=1 Tax=Trichinella pseudospiralis TaxID=6337 RepID=A0A0V1IN26_TRIPS|nr:hypothetical protein T4B_7691 [Trichinella pseudospiralis]
MKEENKRICSKCFVNFRKKQHSTIQLNPPHPTPPPLLPLNKWKGNQISDTDLSIVFHDRLHRCKHPGCEHICLAFRSSNKYNNTTQHRAHKQCGQSFTAADWQANEELASDGWQCNNVNFQPHLAQLDAAHYFKHDNANRQQHDRPLCFLTCSKTCTLSLCILFAIAATFPTTLTSSSWQLHQQCKHHLHINAGSLYTEMIKDAYRPAKRHCIRSQSTIDLQAVVSGHLRHPADGTYSAPDEVVDRGIGPQTSGDTTDETVDSHHFRHRFRCRSSPPPQHVWVAKTTGTFYKPLYERTNVYGNRRYYSRYGNNDPEYFDWDLDAAVSRVKEQQAISYGRPPVQPRYWEHQLFKDMSYLQGEKLISPYLFNKTDDSSNFTKTTYVSSTLRTPSYWTYRFENL